MAARAIVKKIYVNPASLSMIPVFAVSPRIDRTANIRLCSEMVKAADTTATFKPKSKNKKKQPLSSVDADNKVIEAAVVCDDAWKIKEIEETGLRLLQLLQKYRKEREEGEMISDSNDKLIYYMKPIHQLWSKKLEEEERKLLQEGWAHWRNAILGTGFKRCHDRLLLSIQHHHGLGGEETIKFATASPDRGLISARRLPLQRPGPHGLPRQVVMGVVCITTKDAFLLYNPTTGDTSPWIETTTTRKGKARRQVESIALGYDLRVCGNHHKVICISSYLKKRPKGNRYLVVEVLNVRDVTWATGEHQWRKLEFVPQAIQDGERFVLVDGPLYIDGKIYWHYHYERRWATILEFDAARESFLHIPISRFLIQDFLDSFKHVRSMLMEVDGNLAILKSTSDQETSSLCICHSSRRSHSEESCKIEWTEEEVPVPYAYYGCPDFSVQALTKIGTRTTDFIFIQSRYRISYYNRKTKVSLSLRIPASPIRDHFGRMIQFRFDQFRFDQLSI